MNATAAAAAAAAAEAEAAEAAEAEANKLREISTLTTTGALTAGRAAAHLAASFSHVPMLDREGVGGRGRFRVSSRWWKSEGDV